MGTLYVYLRKFMSFCGVCNEEDELREPLKNGLNVILDNQLMSDRYGRRVLVSNLPSGVSNCNVRNENGGPNGSCWSSVEEMESERYSDSWLACSTTSNANAGTEPLESNKNRYISAETYCSPELPGFERTQLVSPKGTSVSHLSSVYSRCDIEMENGGLNTTRRNSSRRNKADVYTSITEVTSGESLSACSLHNSVDSRCCTNYDGDVKEKLTRQRKNSTEPNSSPTKGKKASERETKTVKKLSSLVNKTEKPTEPNLRPTKSKKSSERETKTAKKLSSLVNKTKKPTGKPASSSRSGHQGLNPINLLCHDANAVSVPNGQQLSSEKGCLLAETGSSPSLLGPQKTQLVPQNRSYDDDDVSKGKLICPQNGNTESDPRPVKRKKKGSKSKRKIEGYCSSQKILLVGEGNFSFSACLARAFGSATNMVATSFNSEAYLRSYYKGAMDNISELRIRGCKVLHDVDATSVANHTSLKGQLFDRIIFNFPHCGAFGLTKKARRENRKLIRLFMESSSWLMEPDGEIHIRHKTSKTFLQWGLNGLGAEAGLVLIEEAPFHINKFKGYEAKYGYEGGKFSSDDNFDCYPCCTYKFALSTEC